MVADRAGGVLPARIAGGREVKHLLLFALLSTSASAADFGQFRDAVHRVETSGRVGAIKGDGGRALGPLQIHRGAWTDARVAGRYEDVADLTYASEVMRRYLNRYAAQALAAGDWRTCARVWNGGPTGHRKAATTIYADRVAKQLTKGTK